MTEDVSPEPRIRIDREVERVTETETETGTSDAPAPAPEDVPDLTGTDAPVTSPESPDVPETGPDPDGG